MANISSNNKYKKNISKEDTEKQVTKRHGCLAVSIYNHTHSQPILARTKPLKYTQGPFAMKWPGKKKYYNENTQGKISRQSAGNFPGWQYYGLKSFSVGNCHWLLTCDTTTSYDWQGGWKHDVQRKTNKWFKCSVCLNACSSLANRMTVLGIACTEVSDAQDSLKCFTKWFHFEYSQQLPVSLTGWAVGRKK